MVANERGDRIMSASHCRRGWWSGLRDVLRPGGGSHHPPPCGATDPWRWQSKTTAGDKNRRESSGMESEEINVGAILVERDKALKLIESFRDAVSAEVFYTKGLSDEIDELHRQLREGLSHTTICMHKTEEDRKKLEANIVALLLEFWPGCTDLVHLQKYSSKIVDVLLHHDQLQAPGGKDKDVPARGRPV